MNTRICVMKIYYGFFVAKLWQRELKVWVRVSLLVKVYSIQRHNGFLGTKRLLLLLAISGCSSCLGIQNLCQTFTDEWNPALNPSRYQEEEPRSLVISSFIQHPCKRNQSHVIVDVISERMPVREVLLSHLSSKGLTELTLRRHTNTNTISWLRRGVYLLQWQKNTQLTN